MATTATYRCKECQKPFEARTADRERGWAKYCSKSCKAVEQTRRLDGRKVGKTNYPRHDGHSPMKFKFCETCGDPAVNGVYSITGRIEWLCESHMIEAQEHPFSSEALGQD